MNKKELVILILVVLVIPVFALIIPAIRKPVSGKR
jgi:hypothetical protein